MTERFARAAARCSFLVKISGLVLIAVLVLSPFFAPLSPFFDRGPLESRVWLALAGIVLVGIGLALSVLPPAIGGPAVALAPPVQGAWTAVNSPTDRVPSHGTHGLGQTYAVDLLRAPAEGAAEHEAGRKPVGAFPPPESYPSFGLPILSPANGEVVTVVSTRRDHGGRSGQLGRAWFNFESTSRELRGAREMLGNHVVLRLEDGSHFVLAHLKRGSIPVTPGDRVSVGDVIGACGNSGNSTEPHLHCQRQDIAATVFAAGLPWTVEPGGIPRFGLRCRAGLLIGSSCD